LPCTASSEQKASQTVSQGYAKQKPKPESSDGRDREALWVERQDEGRHEDGWKVDGGGEVAAAARRKEGSLPSKAFEPVFALAPPVHLRPSEVASPFHPFAVDFSSPKTSRIYPSTAAARSEPLPSARANPAWDGTQCHFCICFRPSASKPATAETLLRPRVRSARHPTSNQSASPSPYDLNYSSQQDHQLSQQSWYVGYLILDSIPPRQEARLQGLLADDLPLGRRFPATQCAHKLFLNVHNMLREARHNEASLYSRGPNERHDY